MGKVSQIQTLVKTEEAYPVPDMPLVQAGQINTRVPPSLPGGRVTQITNDFHTETNSNRQSHWEATDSPKVEENCDPYCFPQ